MPEPLEPAGSSWFSGTWWPHAKEVLLRRRRQWITNWAIVVVATAGLSMLLPKWYLATATLLPPSNESELAVSFTQLLRGGELNSARLPRTTSPEDIFIAILTSRRVGRAAVQKFGLQEAYHAKLESQAVDRFGKHLFTGTTKQGVVFVSVEDRSPQRAADMTNFLVDALDLYNKDIRMTAGKSARIFVEKRLDETRVALRLAEDTLRGYQIRHRGAAAGALAGSASGAGLMAERIAMQVRLETLLKTESESSEDARRARARLDALDRELRTLPEAGTEVSRLAREVRIQDQVYVLLTEQAEEAKVREHKDTPTVQVLDRAEVPDKRWRPRRGILVMAALILGLLESCLWALYADRAAAKKARPASR